MKILKTVLLIIWAIVTIGLVIYNQNLKTQVEMKQDAIDISVKVMADMSEDHLEYYENMVLLRKDSLHLVDIDSLFENSFFLTKYEEEMKKENE